MSLEQIINAQSKNRMKGIMQYADVSSAVNRWLVITSMKAKLVNILLEQADMQNIAEPSKETRKSSIVRDQNCLSELKKVINESMNPFCKQLDREVLFNIKTGRQASSVVKHFLLNIREHGEEKRDKFVKQCQQDPGRFEKAISRVEIYNFASGNFSQKNTSRKAAQVAEAKGTQDLFGRLLYLAVVHDIDLAKVLKYPILPEPACFAHPDGTMRQSEKATVFHKLKNTVNSQPPKRVDAVIVDGMFLLRSCLFNISFVTFGAFASILLK